MASSGMTVFPAWLVHLYTASGAVVAFFGLAAVADGRYPAAFFWMVVATAVDATDGVFARMARVKERLPAIDGARLDDIVDYLSYVLLPMFLLHHSGALPAGWGIAVVAAVLISSAFGFVAADAKTDDHFFTGFPSYWNIVALYLHILRFDPIANAAVLLVLCALVFVRVGYVYPTRTPVLRLPTILLGVVYGVLVIAMIRLLPDVPRWLVAISFVYPIYYVALSIALNRRRRAALAGA